jgi:hypothetical protein
VELTVAQRIKISLTKLHYSFHNSPPLDSTPCQANSFTYLHTISLKPMFIFSPCLYLCGLPDRLLCSIFPMRATYIIHLIPLRILVISNVFLIRQSREGQFQRRCLSALFRQYPVRVSSVIAQSIQASLYQLSTGLGVQLHAPSFGARFILSCNYVRTIVHHKYSNIIL